MPEVEMQRQRVGWRMIAFGEAVRNITDRADPTAEESEFYVGLEHLDSGSLMVRRWGSARHLEGTKLRMRKGDVLFAKRNAYLKRVAIAPHDGLFSAHGMVLRANEEVLLHDFLPFFMQSDYFWDRAIRISVGSLSPTINWKTLAKEEFALPLIDEQRRMVAALQSTDRCVESHWTLREQIVQLINRFVIDTFQQLQRDFDLVPVTKLGEATMGRQKSPKYARGINPRPYMRVANIGHLELRLDEVEQMDFSDAEMTKFRLQPGDILLTEGDLISHFKVGRPAIFQGEIENCCFQNTLIRFRPNEDIPELFTLLLFEGARLNHVFAKAAKTTTVTHLGLGRFKDVELPSPDSHTQAILAEQLGALLESRTQASTRLEDIRALRGRLVRRVFE